MREILYRIEDFNPEGKSFIVNYYLDNPENGIRLNLLLPVKKDKTGYLSGEDLDNFIIAFAPIDDMLQSESVPNYDTSEIDALVYKEEPDTEDIVDEYKEAIQTFMDSEAQKLGYDNVFTVISYENDDNPKFATEASAFKKWRSAVWTYGLGELNKALNGEIEIPSIDEFISSLPTLNIEY